MKKINIHSDSKYTGPGPFRRAYLLLARRCATLIMFGALFCTLAAKLFHAYRMNFINEYPGWVAADIIVLMTVELVLAILCFRWHLRRVIRTAMIIAVVICTWSVINAAWLIRMGRQILPSVMLPLFRDPLNSLGIVGVNLAKMPATAVILLAPSAVALTFFFFALASALPPLYNRKRFFARIALCVVIITFAILVRFTMPAHGSSQIAASAGLRYNAQLKALTSVFPSKSNRRAKIDFANAKRKIPTADQLTIAFASKHQRVNHNIVIVVLEGVQRRYTSLADDPNNLTPFLTTLAQQGVEFTNFRSSLTHTTKALFALLTGRLPSVFHDLAEAVPADKPYAGLATILKQHLGFRTAFFQSAKGNFECRPALVHNLGFDKFWARDDLNDPNVFIGYLASDEFSMLEPVVEWIQADTKPFLLTILCSVTHDPYQAPDWFAEPAKDPIERYKQTICYTDKFIAAIDVELTKLNLANKTIFCVVGDHGEGFGEHGLLGHERIGFDEAMHVPWIIRAPFMAGPKTKVTAPVSSIDLTPTLLSLLGFDNSTAGFDGIDGLGVIANDRKVFFSGWLGQSPAGFVQANQKFVYNPTTKLVSVYDLAADPLEQERIEPNQPEADQIIEEIVGWRKGTIFKLSQKRFGKRIIFDRWLCRWTDRTSSAKYKPKGNK